jgi:hypothetical protein
VITIASDRSVLPVTPSWLRLRLPMRIREGGNLEAARIANFDAALSTWAGERVNVTGVCTLVHMGLSAPYRLIVRNFSFLEMSLAEKQALRRHLKRRSSV